MEASWRLSLAAMRTSAAYNGFVGVLRTIAAALLTCALSPSLMAAPEIFQLKDVRAGQRGVGRTVFAGTKVEDFQFEVLGVLENLGPKQSIILARLSGGPIANTGVMQGMSGSPVYIDGKLVGAVAMSFPLSKEAIAGIRPIEDMLRVVPDAPRNVAGNLPPRAKPLLAGDARLEEILTPVSFSGFTSATLDHFAPQLRQLGFEPRQGISGGGAPGERMGDPKLLEPGSMISVQLLSGDMSVGADGTITAIDGDKVYAFGHRFLAQGPTELPFARAEVLALLPSINSSFKISTAREWMGTITADRDVAVSGVLGKQAPLIPLEIRVGQNTYRLRMIQDRTMTPLLTQMAIFSAIESTQRSIGAQTYSVRGRMEFESGAVSLDDVYSGDLAVAAFAAGGVSSTLGFALQSGFDAMKLKSLTLDIGAIEKRSQRQIAALVAPRTARPGDDVEITTVFTGENGAETPVRTRYKVPVGTPPGPLYLTVSDSTATNIIEFQAAVGIPQKSAGQVLSLLNGLRSNERAYLRVWRSEPSFTVEGRDLPDPPPSLSMILTRQQTGTTNLQMARGAKLAEVEISPGAGFVVTGTKTVQVEVKE
ncbi:MAG: SpoIVB peptidase S55 domain-containing protein [Bryobacteraceae bacterium]